MALKHHYLILVLGTGEATHVELGHVMMLLGFIRGHRSPPEESGSIADQRGAAFL